MFFFVFYESCSFLILILQFVFLDLQSFLIYFGLFAWILGAYPVAILIAFFFPLFRPVCPPSSPPSRSRIFSFFSEGYVAAVSCAIPLCGSFFSDSGGRFLPQHPSLRFPPLPHVKWVCHRDGHLVSSSPPLKLEGSTFSFFPPFSYLSLLTQPCFGHLKTLANSRGVFFSPLSLLIERSTFLLETPSFPPRQPLFFPISVPPFPPPLFFQKLPGLFFLCCAPITLGPPTLRNANSPTPSSPLACQFAFVPAKSTSALPFLLIAQSFIPNPQKTPQSSLPEFSFSFHGAPQFPMTLPTNTVASRLLLATHIKICWFEQPLGSPPFPFPRGRIFFFSGIAFCVSLFPFFPFLSVVGGTPSIDFRLTVFVSDSSQLLFGRVTVFFHWPSPRTRCGFR